LVAFFFCAELTKVGAGGGVEHEQIEIHEVGLEEAADWLAAQARRGLLIDSKVYAGLYFAERQSRSS
jgi:ADP-ribose pyrophosphatase